MRRPWYVSLCLGLVLPLVGCGSGDTIAYQIHWVFVNTSAAPAVFIASDATEFEVTVPAGGTEASSTDGETRGATTTQVKVTVQQASLTKGVQYADAQVEDRGTTTVTATWDGNVLSLDAGGSCAQAQATIPSAPSASSCTAPKTWNLVGVTGTTTGTYQDMARSGSGTLSGFNPPQTVVEGETYTVSATFGGSMTAAAGWDGITTNMTVGLADYDTLNPLTGPEGTNPYTFKQVAVTGTISTSVTITVAWSPRPYGPATTTISIAAFGSWFVAGSSPRQVATYQRAP